MVRRGQGMGRSKVGVGRLPRLNESGFVLLLRWMGIFGFDGVTETEGKS